MTKSQKMYYKRLRLGKCVACGKPNETPDKVRCPACRAKEHQYYVESAEFFEKNGLCKRCNRYYALPERKFCHECLAILANRSAKRVNTEADKEKMRKHCKTLYQQRKEAGLCTRCGKPRGKSRSTVLCESCRIKANRNMRNSQKNKYGIPRKERPSHGLCYRCGKPYSPNGYKVCDECHNKLVEWGRNVDRTKRREQISKEIKLYKAKKGGDAL